jgi:hypothetical protein
MICEFGTLIELVKAIAFVHSLPEKSQQPLIKVTSVVTLKSANVFTCGSIVVFGSLSPVENVIKPDKECLAVWVNHERRDLRTYRK